MNVKSIILSGLVTLAIGTTVAKADPLVKEDSIPGEFSGSITLTNEYQFRGISQTDDVPAIQGSIDWAHEVGIHAGIWASNVKFTDASIEIDYTVGFGRSIDAFNWDISAIYYSYPGAAGSLNYDYWEIAPSIGYDFGLASIGVGANYSPEYFGDSGDALYLSASVSVPILKLFTFAANVGHQSIDKNANFGTDDYIDWGVNVTADIAGFDVSAGYSDTDLPKSQCADGDSCGLFLVSVGRSF